MLTLLAEVPVPGDTVEAGGFRFSVLEVRDRRIRRLRGEQIAVPVDEETESD